MGVGATGALVDAGGAAALLAVVAGLGALAAWGCVFVVTGGAWAFDAAVDAAFLDDGVTFDDVVEVVDLVEVVDCAFPAPGPDCAFAAAAGEDTPFACTPR